MHGDESEGIRITRWQAAAGWLVLILLSGLYIAFPNIENKNGDVAGWESYLDDYRNAEGNFFFPTAERDPGTLRDTLTDDELDSLGERVRNAGWWVLWNPHHLLYLPATATAYRMTAHVFTGVESGPFLRVWNSILAALTIFLLFRLLCRLSPGSPYPLAWCIFLATSPTFFRYATDGSQYITPLTLVLIASGGLYAYVSGRNPRSLVKSGLWLALAILFHQIVSIIALFILIPLFFIARRTVHADGLNDTRPFWITTVLVIGIPVLVYVIVGAFALGPTGEFSVAGLFRYATLYAHQQSYWTDSVLYGFLTTLITVPGFYFDNLRTHNLLFQSIWYTAIVAILPALWLTTIVNLRKLESTRRTWLVITFAWFIILVIFLSFWTPGHDFYHLFLVVPIAGFSLLGAESSRRSGVRGILDVVLFSAWCLIAIIINIPYALSGAVWIH